MRIISMVLDPTVTTTILDHLRAEGGFSSLRGFAG